MIGGYDIILQLAEPHSPLYLSGAICSLVSKTWPEFMVEPDIDSEDIFLYKNMAARESWDKNGLTEENESDMLYVLYNDDRIQFTIVVGDKHKGDVAKIVDDIKTVLGATESNGNKNN